jgi:hypothetical protein
MTIWETDGRFLFHFFLTPSDANKARDQETPIMQGQ